MNTLAYVNDGNQDLIFNIETALRMIPVGCTRVVFGMVVTRWNDEEVELGTWGRSQVSIEAAAEAMASSSNSKGVR